MTDTTASFYDVTSFDGRIFPLGEGRRAIRLCLNDVIDGLGTVAAVCATVTVVAVSIINTTLATGPNLHATAPIGPEAVALANRYPTFAGSVNFSDSARVSTDSADALTFEARRPRATAPASTSAVPLVSQHPVEPASNVASPQPNPLHPPQSQAKPETADAPDSTDVVQLTPAAAPESARPITLTRPPKLIPEWANSMPLPSPHSARHEIGGSPVGQAVPQVATALPPPASIFEKLVTPQQAHNKSMPLPDSASRTAVYDIAAHTVYMPNGDRLEAHSGFGNKLDDPRYVSVKDQGPTPPNVYDLALREQLFHGVLALRLNPVGGGNMFGRDGMLAHPYMRGANGQSNGCVSIKDYPAFLNAYLRGEVDRLVIVSNLGNTSWRTVSALHGPAYRYAENNP
jgi:Protein of unknown function (DUF2778)